MPGNENNDPVMAALTERLTRQAEEGTSSSQSKVEGVIGQAIANTRESGQKSREALQIEREREVSFARDRGSAKFTDALESRTGYATQVAAFRELTETTEKSIRDLDQRYQQSILQSDAETASQIANLQVQKLRFQQEAEQNFFSNALALGGMNQQRQLAEQEMELTRKNMEQTKQFKMLEMANSQVQFAKNLGLKYQEMELAEQSLELDRQRLNLSRSEFSLRKKELEEEKNKTFIQGTVFSQLKAVAEESGNPRDYLSNLNEDDVTDLANQMAAGFGPDLGKNVSIDEIKSFVRQSSIEALATLPEPEISEPLTFKGLNTSFQQSALSAGSSVRQFFFGAKD